jgi:hypothetical protein
MDGRRKQTDDPRQTRLALGARDAERWQLLDNLRLLGRSSLSGRVRSLVELVGRVAGDGELVWRIDGPPDARDCLCTRLNETPRSVRRAIEVAEQHGLLSVRRLRRSDRSYDRLALSVHWHRLAARDFGSLVDPPATRCRPAEDQKTQGKADRPIWPDGVANLAAQARPIWPDGVANLAAQYKQEQAIPPPPPNPHATATAGEPIGDTGRGQAWAAAAEKLRETGFASWRRLLIDVQQAEIPPEDFLAACEIYLANRAKFRGPGALAAWVRNGDWPTDGVLAPAAAKAVTARSSEREQASDREQAASRIVFAGRRARKPEDVIQAELAAAGLSWG